MPVEAIDIAMEVRKAYPTPLRQEGIAHLVINEDGLIVWFDVVCTRIFGYTANEIIGNTINLFLPENMQGAIHDRLVAGVFQGFKEALKTNNAAIGLKSMGRSENGQARSVKGYAQGHRPIEFKLEFGPLVHQGQLYAVAFIQSPEATEDVNLSQSVRGEADLVIRNARLQIVDVATDMAGKKFTGVFGFYVNQVFGQSRLGRIVSGFATIFTFGGIFGLAFLLWDSRFGTKPSYQQYNIGEPTGVEGQPIQESPPSNRKPPSPGK
jgi:hypothetical protein